jgi:hypothetical protein
VPRSMPMIFSLETAMIVSFRSDCVRRMAGCAHVG